MSQAPKRSLLYLLSIAWVLLTLTALVPAAMADAPPPDLTGTWEGVLRCKGFFQGQPFTEEQQGFLFITQNGADLNIEIFTNLYNGAVIADADNSNKGRGALIGCGAQAEPISDNNEMVHFTVVVNPDTGRTSFKATSVRAVGALGVINNSVGHVAICKWRFERTNATNPNASACPF